MVSKVPQQSFPKLLCLGKVKTSPRQNCDIGKICAFIQLTLLSTNSVPDTD